MMDTNIQCRAGMHEASRQWWMQCVAISSTENSGYNDITNIGCLNTTNCPNKSIVVFFGLLTPPKTHIHLQQHAN